MFAFSGLLVAVGLGVFLCGTALARRAADSSGDLDARTAPLTGAPIARSALGLVLTGLGAACFLAGVVLLFVAAGLALGGA